MPFHPNPGPREPITTPEQLVHDYIKCVCGHYRTIHSNGMAGPCDGDMRVVGTGWTYCECKEFRARKALEQ